FSLGLYHRRYLTGAREIVVRLTCALGVAFVLLTIIFYVIPYTRIWISALLPSMFIAWAGLTLGRFLFLRLADISNFKRRIVVLGTGRQAQKIEAAEQWLVPIRFVCIGFVALDDTAMRVTPSRVLANNDLISLCSRAEVDDIVMALDER